jgi:hypothetical protein
LDLLYVVKILGVGLLALATRPTSRGALGQLVFQRGKARADQLTIRHFFLTMTVQIEGIRSDKTRRNAVSIKRKFIGFSA